MITGQALLVVVLSWMFHDLKIENIAILCSYNKTTKNDAVFSLVATSNTLFNINT